MKAVLITRCGCSKVMEIEHFMDTIHVPLKTNTSMIVDELCQKRGIDAVKVLPYAPYRTFVFDREVRVGAFIRNFHYLEKIDEGV